ncbi:MAG: class I SAM-dependent methyltransferase [Candidatus Sulfotelmatobacter sp.]
MSSERHQATSAAEQDISVFWEANPCGDSQVGGLEERFGGDFNRFFSEYDAFRYRREKHILPCLDRANFAGKKVLEIGLGQGADSEQIIRRGGRWSGLDLTAESVMRVKRRMQLRNLPYDDLKVGSVLEIPYADNSFDMVYSFGVLHHVPEIHHAQAEIARVLRPGGELVMMVYAKWSLNYVLSIGVLRRTGLAAMVALRLPGKGIYAAHVRNARQEGLFRYLRLNSFVHRSTDGPDNPYAKVYGLREVREDFPAFKVTRSYKQFMHAPPLPVKWMPLQKAMGWHLMVHQTVRKGADLTRAG